MAVRAGVNWFWAAFPMDEVKWTVDRAVEILKDRRLKGTDKRQERRRRLHQIIYPHFDFAEMARRSLGDHWGDFAAREEEFVPVFAEFVENSYFPRIDSYRDEKIFYVRERMNGEFAEVDTKIVRNPGNEVPIHFELHLAGGEWKVYDVVIDHVSVVGHCRSRLDSMLAGSSYEDLVSKMKEKESL